MEDAQSVPEAAPSPKRARVADADAKLHEGADMDTSMAADAEAKADVGGTGSTDAPSAAQEAALSASLERLEDIEADWSALQPSIDALRASAGERQECWESMLQRVLTAVACSDAELAREQEELAVERYGSEASLFCTLPPTISWLLPASAQSEEEVAFAEEVQTIVNVLLNIRERILAHINDAKARGDRDVLRMLGPKHAAYGKESKSLQGLDSMVGRRLTVASKRINAYRSQQMLRDVDPTLLRDIDASFRGYQKVLDFYRNSDAQRYSFNRQLSGPQHFADIRRNVAVLEVWDNLSGRRIFNAFAVSGADAPGVQPAELEKGIFAAIEVEDGCGETYSRDLDAEFKLCSVFPVVSCLIGQRPHASSALLQKAPLHELQACSIRAVAVTIPGSHSGGEGR